MTIENIIVMIAVSVIALLCCLPSLNYYRRALSDNDKAFKAGVGETKVVDTTDAIAFDDVSTLHKRIATGNHPCINPEE